MSKGRKLSSDEKALWNKISKTISDPKTISTDINEEKEIVKKEDNLIKPRPILTPDLKNNPRIKPTNENSSGAMDQNILRRLKRGKLSPEAKLDLHGLTTDQAYDKIRQRTRFCFPIALNIRISSFTHRD